MLISFLYLALRKLIELVALRPRSAAYKELEIVVLRHELNILRRQVHRPELRPADRIFLAAAARLLPRRRWSSFFVTPQTLLAWHRRIAARRWTSPNHGPGRPRIDPNAERFVGTVRRECLDWLLIANPRHLERVLRTFVDHYNGHRPHRALVLLPPDRANVAPLPSTSSKVGSVSRRDRLGELIHEYRAAA